jgi:carboxylesterase type B
VSQKSFIVEIVGEEDCLTVDVFTPSVVYSSSLPVVVYLAGDDTEVVPSARLAADHSVVFVVVNVRQGALGFLSHNVVSGESGRGGDIKTL